MVLRQSRGPISRYGVGCQGCRVPLHQESHIDDGIVSWGIYDALDPVN